MTRVLTSIAVAAMIGLDGPARADGSAPAVSAHPAPAPAAPAGGMDTQTLAAVVSAGVGIVGFSVAAVFGAEAISRKSDAQSVCPGSTYCRTQQGVDRWNDASRAANVATVGFVIGCVGLAEAAVLWLTPGPISKAGAQLGLGPTGLRMRGTF